MLQGIAIFMMMRLIPLILLVLFLTGCHKALVKPSNTAPVYYTDSRSVHLLPTAAMKESIDLPQHIEGIFTRENNKEDSFSGDAWVRANDSILSINIFSAFGTTIAELTYAGDSVAFESPVMDVEKMKAEYVLADFQACFYPYEILRHNFEQNGFVFAEENAVVGKNFKERKFVRILSADGKIILKIEKDGPEIHLVNELRKYSYHITLGEAE